METESQSQKEWVLNEFPTRWEDYLNGNLAVFPVGVPYYLFPTRWEDYLNGNIQLVVIHVFIASKFPTRWEDYLNGNLFALFGLCAKFRGFPTRWEDYLNGNKHRGGWILPLA